MLKRCWKVKFYFEEPKQTTVTQPSFYTSIHLCDSSHYFVFPDPDFKQKQEINFTSSACVHCMFGQSKKSQRGLMECELKPCSGVEQRVRVIRRGERWEWKVAPDESGHAVGQRERTSRMGGGARSRVGGTSLGCEKNNAPWQKSAPCQHSLWLRPWSLLSDEERKQHLWHQLLPPPGGRQQQATC